jgi:glutamyl-tRNA reductase
VSVVVVGLNHRSVPLDLLERMSIDDSRLPKALHDVFSREHISEAVVLSTCNRTEIYVVAEKFHGAYADLRNFLGEMAYLPPEDFADHLYVQHDDEAVAHLFAVTAGLESAVVGEAEVLGQVRQAWERAQEEGTTGSSLNLLFRHALEVGKRARTETGIARHIASVSTAAVAMAAERLGSLDGTRILVLGAGEMGEGMVRALASGGVDDIRIANRTWERAVELADGLVADGLAGRAVRLADLNESLAEVDLLLTSTGASSIMLEHGDLSRVMRARAGRPLLIVDVAVPRDVDPSAADLDGVTLLDMDDLRAFADAGMAERRLEVAAVQRMLDEELERFVSVATAREVAPLVAGLHERGEAIRSAELDRFRARLGELDGKQLDAVEALTKGIVAKLLHDPTIGLKDAAGTPRGERLAEALRDLFDL